MGTNYYWRDGTHIAKTSAIGRGRFKVFWAQPIAEVLNHERTEIVLDEYGREMALYDMWLKLSHAEEYDTSTVGTEFS